MPTENNDSTAEMSLSDIVADIDAAVDAETGDESQLELDLQPQQDEGEQDVSEESDQVTEQSDTDEQAPDTEEIPSELSESEQSARAAGWRPKDEFNGPKDKWVNHDEFNRRAELFDKIGSQNKAIKDLNKKLDALINHNQSLETKTREKVLAELEAQKREAIGFGDTEAFDAVEAKIEELEKQESTLKVEDDEPEQAPAQPEQQEIPKPIKDFAERNNTWFEKDREMTEFAVFKVQQATNAGIPINEALEQAEASVKSMFASKLAPAPNPRKSKPAAVMSGQNESRPSTNKQFSDLTSEQKQVWQALKGTMSLDDFLSQIGD